MTRKEIKRRYTHVTKVLGIWNCYFQVGGQSLWVCSDPTKKRANWYADMLTIAIETLLKEQDT